MINRYRHVQPRNEWLYLGCKRSHKRGIVVDGNVGNDIDGKQILLLGIIKSVNLKNLGMSRQRLHHL